MANAGKKPSKTNKGTPPTAAVTPAGRENTSKRDLTAISPINFKVNEEFAHEWRVYCVSNKISQVEQFKTMFEYWKSNH